MKFILWKTVWNLYHLGPHLSKKNLLLLHILFLYKDLLSYKMNEIGQDIWKVQIFWEIKKNIKFYFLGKVKTQVSYPESHPQRSGQRPRPVDWVWPGSWSPIHPRKREILSEISLSSLPPPNSQMGKRTASWNCLLPSEIWKKIWRIICKKNSREFSYRY